jgi:hypothetical protein
MADQIDQVIDTHAVFAHECGNRDSTGQMMTTRGNNTVPFDTEPIHPEKSAAELDLVFAAPVAEPFLTSVDKGLPGKGTQKHEPLFLIRSEHKTSLEAMSEADDTIGKNEWQVHALWHTEPVGFSKHEARETACEKLIPQMPIPVSPAPGVLVFGPEMVRVGLSPSHLVL